MLKILKSNQLVKGTYKRLLQRWDQLLDLGVELGILKTHYSRFVLLTAGRTGSNMLISALHRNPQVIVKHEIFRDTAEPPPGFSLSMIEDEPLKFVNRFVFHHYPTAVKSVGFPLHYYHCQKGEQKSVWDYLVKKEVKVLHLKRNFLKAYVSAQIARKYNVWHVRQSSEMKYLEDACVEIDPKELFHFLDYTTRQSKDYDDLFMKNDHIEVWYENLLEDFDSELDRIQTWLGVTPLKLKPETKLQINRPLSEVVLNYKELKDAAFDTPWISLFDC